MVIDILGQNSIICYIRACPPTPENVGASVQAFPEWPGWYVITISRTRVSLISERTVDRAHVPCIISFPMPISVASLLDLFFNNKYAKLAETTDGILTKESLFFSSFFLLFCNLCGLLNKRCWINLHNF